MDDYEKPRRPRPRSLIHGTAASPSDEQSGLLAGKRRRSAELTTRCSRRDQTAHYDMKSKSPHTYVGQAPTRVT